VNYYQPYYQPMQDHLTQQRQNSFQPAASGGIIWVQGEDAAKAYMVAPGNSVLLMDSEKSAFYIKSTDPSGMPLPLRVFDFTERTARKPEPLEETVSREEFAALMARIEVLEGKKRKTKEETDG